MITCNFCADTKPEEDFYVSNRSQCKECVKRRVRAHREANLERIQELDRKRGYLPHRKAKVQAHQPVHRATYPEKYVARNAVSNALRDGKLMRPDACESCSIEGKLHAHHDDYSKPLGVRWLCTKCHGRHHQRENEKMRQEATK